MMIVPVTQVASRWLLAGVSLSAFTTPALAQTSIDPPAVQDSTVTEPGIQDDSAPAGAGSQDIIVTGTRIRGIAPAGSPVIGLDQSAIQNSGATTATEVLRQLPQVFNLGASDTQFTSSNSANANVTAGTAINLRGLGTEATLTLISGRRAPPQGAQAQYFDPSVIPTAAIGRVEVLLDGGSAIYGSDAVGGVVNLNLRRNYNGFEASARYGFANDLDQVVLSAVGGRTWSTGSVMIAGEYNRRSNLETADRARYYTGDLTPFGGADLRSFNALPGNIRVGGVRYAIPAGQDGTNLSAAQLAPNTTNRISPHLGGDALPESERVSAAATFEQEVGDWLKVSAEGIYSWRQADRAVGPGGAILTVPRTNPFFVHPTNPAATSVQVEYSFLNDFGVTRRLGENEFIFGAVELDAELFADWEGSVFANWGRSDDDSSLNGVNNAALNAALASSDPSTAFNPFGPGGNTNPATLAAINALALVTSTVSELAEYGISLSGSLLQLPGGRLRTAFGYTRQDAENINTIANSSGTSSNTVLSTSETTASRTVDSVFGELFVPLFSEDNATTGLQELSLSIAARYDRYSDFGSTTNPKIGLVWRPVNDLRLRGSFGTSFRAPGLPDTNERSSLTITVSDFADPQSATGLSRTLWVRGPDPDLGPEQATIYSFGGDYEPSFVDGLTVSATYFNVEYTDRIDSPGNNTLALSRPDLAALIVRNPSAALVQPFLDDPLYTGVETDPSTVQVFLDGRKKNIGVIRTDGLEFQARYLTGDWRFAANASYLLSFEKQITPSASLLEYVDTIGNPLRFRARLESGWSSGPAQITGYLNYAGGYNNNSVTPVQKIDQYATVDLSARYNLRNLVGAPRDLELTLDVQNMFDRLPPIVLNGNLAFDPEVAGVLGRFVLIGLRTRF